MAKRKPTELQAGKTYRLYELFSTAPSDEVVLLTEVDPPGWNRQVRYVALGGDVSKPLLWWYTPMMQRIHSEAPSAVN